MNAWILISGASFLSLTSKLVCPGKCAYGTRTLVQKQKKKKTQTNHIPKSHPYMKPQYLIPSVWPLYVWMHKLKWCIGTLGLICYSHNLLLAFQMFHFPNIWTDCFQSLGMQFFNYCFPCECNNCYCEMEHFISEITLLVWGGNVKCDGPWIMFRLLLYGKSRLEPSMLHAKVSHKAQSWIPFSSTQPPIMFADDTNY